MKNRKLVAAIACRNQGSRLYGKPIQNLDVEKSIRILDNIVNCLKSINCIDEIVLGISQGIENDIFKLIAKEFGIDYIIGDQVDVLHRLIQCGIKADATDIFRITSESPFLYFDPVEQLWEQHVNSKVDATFLDNIVDGCGFEIITLNALKVSHDQGEKRHRSELCTLYIRENADKFLITKQQPPESLIRWDLRLTVDNPEDLVVCREVYKEFSSLAPRIPIPDIIKFLDANPDLIKLIEPFTEAGYSTMNL